MSNVTVTFDPENMFTTTSFARARGITASGALAWMNRHADRLPAPAFVLRTERVDNRPMYQKFWHAKDGETILKIADGMAVDTVQMARKRAAQAKKNLVAAQKKGRSKSKAVLPARDDAQTDSVLQ